MTTTSVSSAEAWNQKTISPPFDNNEESDERALLAVAHALQVLRDNGEDEESRRLWHDLSKAQREKMAQWNGFSTAGAMTASWNDSTGAVPTSLAPVVASNLYDTWRTWKVQTPVERKAVAHEYGYASVASFEEFLTLQQAQAQSYKENEEN